MFNQVEKVSPYQAALHDFRLARQKAALQDVFAQLTGKSNRLLSFEEVASRLKLSTRSDRGVQQIPLAAIVGSVGRYTDFTRTFLPRQSRDEQRWAMVKTAMVSQDEELPPIDVYKVGEVYFILDGNHRVSIARCKGMNFIDAHVIELKTSIPLTPDVQPDDLILKAEYAEFLAQTQIDVLIPNANLIVTVPGQYAKLKKHIEEYGVCEGKDIPCGTTCDEALVLSWYNNFYHPIVTTIRERGLLRWFPQRTETDLYLWVSEYQDELKQDLGWEVSPQSALTSFTMKEVPLVEKKERSTGAWRLARIADRYVEHLFKDILVPLGGSETCWTGLDQALMIAWREDARVHGLHVVRTQEQARSQLRHKVEEIFLARCKDSGVEGGFLVEVGEPVKNIQRRALLTDLVVLNATHPPATGLPGLRSPLRAILRNTFRPMLVVKEKTCTMDRVLLAFDGSSRSKEALFLATYLAEQWKAALTVITLLEENRVHASAQDYARTYLELHEIQAEFLVSRGSHDSLKDVIREREINLLLMGSYCRSWLEELTRGSLVNQVLREMRCPSLICQ